MTSSKNKKGFTLIELLAVIVVLAVIAVIAVPVILNVIEKAEKGALKDSAYGILEAGELYLAKNMSEGIDDTIEFTCSNGKCINGDKEITYKGQIETGRIRIYSDNKIELCITDNKNSALKKVTDKEVEVTTGTCNYDELSYDVSALVSKDDYDKVVNELNDLKALVNQTDATVSDIAKDKKAVTNEGLIVGESIGGVSTEISPDISNKKSSVTIPSDGKYTIVGVAWSAAYNNGSIGVRISVNGTITYTDYNTSLSSVDAFPSYAPFNSIVHTNVELLENDVVSVSYVGGTGTNPRCTLFVFKQ